jgi:type VI secretion system protein ImpH
LTFLSELARVPRKFDFHQVLRRLENVFPEAPRWGTAARPGDEPVRFEQDPSLRFGASALSAFSPASDGRPARLSVAFFGLFGPHGPLPLHLTEYARDRIRHFGDHTFAGFANIFNHRMLVLFHRAWTAAQPTASHDRPDSDRFRAYVAAVFGHDFAGRPAADSETWTKLQYAAHFANSTRHAAGLESLLADYFGMPVTIEQFVGQWLDLPDTSQFRLGISAEVSTLGRTAILGRRVWRSDQKFRIVLGPLSQAEFQRLLPGGGALSELSGLVRAYVCDELDWDVRLVLADSESDQAQLGRGSRLGWNSRLGIRPVGNSDHVTVQPHSQRTERKAAA